MSECLKVTAGQEEGLQKDQLGYTYVEPDDYKHLWLDNDRLVVSNLASFTIDFRSGDGSNHPASFLSFSFLRCFYCLRAFYLL